MAVAVSAQGAGVPGGMGMGLAEHTNALKLAAAAREISAVRCVETAAAAAYGGR